MIAQIDIRAVLTAWLRGFTLTIVGDARAIVMSLIAEAKLACKAEAIDRMEAIG
ncbi:hypothetical protein [Ruegeria atlantica]|uniref:Uncharacterized protein n=1 Tax=Ruegeria atlantica TaxID=81569 RepID=A0A0N7LQA0_9RHOB|nr:hypothetical protein [Ruegeria atlantica]CUH47436.1 hypothetical protein RUA4292_01606 [Ruegeria atlantica]